VATAKASSQPQAARTALVSLLIHLKAKEIKTPSKTGVYI
jgi:hypothetical protein